MTKRGANIVLIVGMAMVASAGFSRMVNSPDLSTEEGRWATGTAGVIGVIGVIVSAIGFFAGRKIERDGETVPVGGPRGSSADNDGNVIEPGREHGSDAVPEPARPLTWADAGRIAWPWALVVITTFVVVFAASLALHVKVGVLMHELKRLLHLSLHPGDTQEGQLVEWKAPRAIVLVAGAVLVGLVAFHLRRRRVAAMGFSQVGLIRKRGVWSWLADLPGALRVVAVGALAIGLARPETYRVVKKEVDSIDIMLVVDMSKSMEETDMQRDRLDAAQRVIRKFLRKTKSDRIGLVVFGQQAMLMCPLTQDTKLLEQIVSDLAIGDVPELGTAIGDGLALGLAQLRRSDAKSKVVILLSDGDTNWVTRFDPEQAAQTAKDMKVKVYTLLVGSETSDLFGGMSVNPATLRNIAAATGGEFFRAADYESFDRGFQTVRKKLDTTKRTITERVPDKQLFVSFAAIAGLLLMLEWLLSHTRLRRLP